MEEEEHGEVFMFGPYKKDSREVFYSTPLSYALVNIRPVLPDDEICDLWITARLVGSRLEKHYNATSLTLNLQDGPEAGQTVEHVHIHVVPRKAGNFERNDDIYDELTEKEKELKRKLDLDMERKDRTVEEMTCEADIYRSLFV